MEKSNKVQVSKEAFITAIINDIKTSKKEVRQEAKPIYFALNYMGTYRTLMRTRGFSEEKSKFIEKSHKELYKVYYDYIANKINQTKETGYTTLAFGLRLRSPVLKASSTTDIPNYIIEQEERSVGNALFQSYGLMTLNALVNIMKDVWEHPVYFDRIVPITTIYDSIYLELDNDLEMLTWINKTITKHMLNIDDLPELKHDQIAISADVEVLYPDWSSQIPLPNNATEEEVQACIEKWYKKQKETK